MKALTARGERTRQKLLESAERIFAELGYQRLIVKITEAAGVGQGTFYLYFSGKKQVFEEVVLDLNSRVRHAMTEAAEKGTTRAERELLGFGAFFRFTADHPALYRIISQAEFVSPETLVARYERLMRPSDRARQAMEAGEIAGGDPEVLAWSLMGIGDLVGMRWILWNGEKEMPEAVFDELARIIVRCSARGHRPVSIGFTAMAAYLPQKWMSAAEISDASSIPEQVILEKFGLRGKHIAAADEHVSDMSVEAASRLFAQQDIDPAEIDVVLYYGSLWKDYRSGRPRRGSRIGSAA